MTSKDLMHRASDRNSNSCSDEWVQTAFNEILGSIYSSEIKKEEEEKLIDELAYYVMEKLNIKESEFNWQSIEEWHHSELYRLTSYEFYLDFDEAKKIIYKSKVSEDYSWEDISSKEMPIDKINKKMLGAFKEEFDEKFHLWGREELIKKCNYCRERTM
jgi:hypothetical protein